MIALRMTEKQAGLLFGDRSTNSPPKRQRQQQPRESLPENVLESQINGVLEVRGWKLIRQQSGLWIPYHQVAGKATVAVNELRPHRFSKKGEGAADWLAVRPQRPWPNAQFFIYEVKGGGRAPTREQKLYLEKHAACGFLAAFFDDFDGGWPTSFLPWYRRHFGTDRET
jgi:hypothetical protein